MTRNEWESDQRPVDVIIRRVVLVGLLLALGLVIKWLIY